jgi:hypothetical protein
MGSDLAILRIAEHRRQPKRPLFAGAFGISKSDHPRLNSPVLRLDERAVPVQASVFWRNPAHRRSLLMLSPPFIAPRRIDDPVAALAQVHTVYDSAIAHLRAASERFIAGEDLTQRVRAS